MRRQIEPISDGPNEQRRRERSRLTIDANTSTTPLSPPPNGLCSPSLILPPFAPCPLLTHQTPARAANPTGNTTTIITHHHPLFSPPTYAPGQVCFGPRSGRAPPSQEEKGMRRTEVRSYQTWSVFVGSEHCSASEDKGGRGEALGKRTHSFVEGSRWWLNSLREDEGKKEGSE